MTSFPVPGFSVVRVKVEFWTESDRCKVATPAFDCLAILRHPDPDSQAVSMPHTYVARSLFVFALITSLGTAMGRAAAQGGDLATSYAEAQERGRRDESDPETMGYHRDVLLPEFSARYRSLLGACQASLPQPDQTPFSFVAAIGPQGEVLRIWSDRSPPVYSCLRGRLLFERFTPPPRAPFYLYVHMRFTK
jgi:hypothetical protein